MVVMVVVRWWFGGDWLRYGFGVWLRSEFEVWFFVLDVDGGSGGGWFGFWILFRCFEL